MASGWTLNFHHHTNASRSQRSLETETDYQSLDGSMGFHLLENQNVLSLKLNHSLLPRFLLDFQSKIGLMKNILKRQHNKISKSSSPLSALLASTTFCWRFIFLSFHPVIPFRLNIKRLKLLCTQPTGKQLDHLKEDIMIP